VQVTLTRYAVRRQGQAARSVVVKDRIRSEVLVASEGFIKHPGHSTLARRVRHSRPLVKLLMAPAIDAGGHALDQFVLVTLFKIQITRWFKNIHG
jgi:hypothetical protein